MKGVEFGFYLVYECLRVKIVLNIIYKTLGSIGHAKLVWVELIIIVYVLDVELNWVGNNYMSLERRIELGWYKKFVFGV